MPEVSTTFGIGKPKLIVPRFYHIHRRSGAKIVAASGHLEVKNCTNISLRWGSAPDPAARAYSAQASGEGARSSLDKNPTPARLFGPGLTISLEKNPAGPHEVEYQFLQNNL